MQAMFVYAVQKLKLLSHITHVLWTNTQSLDLTKAVHSQIWDIFCEDCTQRQN